MDAWCSVTLKTIIPLLTAICGTRLCLGWFLPLFQLGFYSQLSIHRFTWVKLIYVRHQCNKIEKLLYSRLTFTSHTNKRCTTTPVNLPPDSLARSKSVLPPSISSHLYHFKLQCFFYVFTARQKYFFLNFFCDVFFHFEPLATSYKGKKTTTSKQIYFGEMCT